MSDLALGVLALAGICMLAWKHAAIGPRWIAIVSGMRFLRVCRCVVVMIAVVGIIGSLLQFGEPLNWGWFHLLFDRPGGVVSAAVSAGGKSGEGVWTAVVVLVLALMVPNLAETEERVFRQGRVSWSDIAYSAVMFGPLHLIMGIPIAAAIGVSLGGLWLGYWYRRSYLNAIARGALHQDAEEMALLESTREHVGINLCLLAIVLLAAIT